MIDVFLNITLLAFLAITGVAILRMTNLFAIVMLFGIFSFLSAALFMIMDAVDVAFTEAAVGAGISTVLMITTLALTRNHDEKPSTHRPWLPLIVVLVTGAVLVYGTLDIPSFGDAEAPAQKHIAPQYMERSVPETGIPNVVTSVLASYRGFDTLGEVFVVFTAGISVLLLIGGKRSRTRESKARSKGVAKK